MKSHIKIITAALILASSINVSYSTIAGASVFKHTLLPKSRVPLPTPENCRLYYAAYCAGRDVSRLPGTSELRAFCEICFEDSNTGT